MRIDDSDEKLVILTMTVLIIALSIITMIYDHKTCNNDINRSSIYHQYLYHFHDQYLYLKYY